MNSRPFSLKPDTVDSKGVCIIKSTKLERQYLYLLKVICGSNFEFTYQGKSIITDTIHHKKSVQIIYNSHSAKAAGYFNVFFNLDSEQLITLDKINFFPFDHSSNDFLINLCENDLSRIKAREVVKLLDTVQRYIDPDKRDNMQGMRRKLENLNLTSTSLLTYRIFMENNMVCILGVFDTGVPETRLLLEYKFIHNVFKPAYIEIIKKDG